MTAEERIAQLESENAALQGENAALREERAILVQQLEHLIARLEEVEGRLAKDSHNSSKPPSSDGPARKRGSRRAKSGKQVHTMLADQAAVFVGKPFPVAWGT